MKKISFLILITLTIFVLNGCLVFNTISYDIKLNDDKSGTVSLFVKNIKSDAKDDTDFEADKKNLFEYLLKSDDFVSNMKKSAKKYIVERNLSLDGNELNGTAVYKFDNIIGIENIQFEDGFYYLNLTDQDSVISTNGEVVKSRGYKRILWDSKMKDLKFQMFSSSLNNNSYKELAPFYKQ